MTSDGNNPRHIRDIAHLYLSRAPQRRERAGPAIVLHIAATDRNCFPGFHVANIAATLRCCGYRVNVRECSGVLPNSAYYLALPPRVYIGEAERRGAEWISALDGIRVGFSQHDGWGQRDDGRGGRPVEILHLPPLDCAQSPVRPESAAVHPLLVIASGGWEDTEDLPGAIRRSYGRHAWRAMMRVDDEAASGTREFVDLGLLPTWRSLLNDRVPAVLRDPDTRVARTYQSMCDELLRLASRQLRRRHEPTIPTARAGKPR